MLTISHLNAWFPEQSAFDDDACGETRVLNDVSLVVEAGQTVAVAGESGSGKSVTALSILRLLEENTAIRVTGSITFEGESLLDLPLDAMRTIRGNRIAMIFQEPMTSLNPVFTIGDQLMEPLQRHRRLAKNSARLEAINLLGRTGIEAPETRFSAYPHQLSGGQRQRVMIAMALACSPSLLIADEPTTALDVSTQAQILDLIRDIQDEFGMSVLLITHDLTMVRKIADRIYIMKDGSVVEHGITETIFTRPQQDYTKHLLAAIPQGVPKPKSDTETLLATDGLSCRFTEQAGWKTLFRRDTAPVIAVDNVTLRVGKGTTCGIIGESGSGKTTLGMSLLKLVDSTGDIIFDNTDLQQLSARELRPFRSRIQIVFQDPYSSLSPRLSIGEIVEEGLRVHRRHLSKRERRELVAQVLDDVGLKPDFISRYPHEFSGGQRQRIAIARAIILRPELLILDEPTSALDMTIQAQIIALLKRLQDKYHLTYLFISHDLKVTRALADYIVVLKNGRVVEQGPAARIFAEPADPYTALLLEAAFHPVSG